METIDFTSGELLVPTSETDGTKQRLHVQTSTPPDPAGEAQQRGDYYSWNTLFNAGNMDTGAWIKNTSATRILKLRGVIIADSNASIFSLYRSDGDATGGTEIAGVNWNFASSNVAEARFVSDPNNASVQPTTRLAIASLQAKETYLFPFGDVLRLAPGQAVAVGVDNGGNETLFTFLGYFEDP